MTTWEIPPCGILTCNSIIEVVLCYLVNMWHATNGNWNCTHIFSAWFTFTCIVASAVDSQQVTTLFVVEATWNQPFPDESNMWKCKAHIVILCLIFHFGLILLIFYICQISRTEKMCWLICFEPLIFQVNAPFVVDMYIPIKSGMDISCLKLNTGPSNRYGMNK